MVETDALHTRGRALEDEYFQRVDAALIDRMRIETEREKHLEELIKSTGLHDSELMNHMLSEGIDASNIAAFALTPLVFVAWADGSVTASERQTVVGTALRQGVNSNPIAFRLLEQWLSHRPTRELWKLWKEYASAFYRSLPPTTANKLVDRLIGQCVEVAKASGGILGIGKISDAEQRVIDEATITLSEKSID